MKSHTEELVDKAIAATVSAIEIYNKPNFRYRAETFSILAINGWELLFKAKWLSENDNIIESLYAKKSVQKNNEMQFKLTRSKNPLSHSIDYLAKKLIETKHLKHNAWANIQALLELRDSSVHFYDSTSNLAIILQEIGVASLRNFVYLVDEWFNRDLSEFNFCLMPLSFLELPVETDAILFNNKERNFLNYLKQLDTEADKTDNKYAVTISIEVKFRRTKKNEALGVRIVDSTNTDAPEVRVKEELILEQYSLDYTTLVKHCRKRYIDFKLNKTFHKIRKTICEEKKEKVCKTRPYNPRKPKSGKMTFFKPEILKEFDKHYTKHDE